MARARTDVLILGGGLTGLATAHFLGERGAECAVHEALPVAGGLARSYHKDGFTCDMTGHLLHMRRDENRAFVKKLLKGNLLDVERKSSIFSHGATTPYPFQVNLAGLPPEVSRECLLGFVAAWERKKLKADSPALSFRRWILDTFGEGIARHFMIPYNEKMWRTSLDSLTAEWTSWSVPRPAIEDVVAGALGGEERKFGYNTTFLYPEEGGIGAFSGALARRVRGGVHLGSAVRSLDLARREAVLENGETLAYHVLVSTAPLPRLAAMAKGASAETRRLAGKLRSVNVLNFNLGFRGTRRSESHWTYFPEKKFVFYRVGFPTNFAPSLAPRGCSAAYVEISYRAGTRPDVAALYRRVVEGLKAWGVLTKESDIVMADAQRIEPAYVLFDRAREGAVTKLRDYFRKHGVVSAGRYGQWDYLSMEDSLAIGRDLARELAS